MNLFYILLDFILIITKFDFNYKYIFTISIMTNDIWPHIHTSLISRYGYCFGGSVISIKFAVNKKSISIRLYCF